MSDTIVASGGALRPDHEIHTTIQSDKGPTRSVISDCGCGGLAASHRYESVA